MRVAIVAPLVTAIVEPQVGGSQALVADIATGLAARGHDVAVFAATGSDVPGVETVDVGVDPDALGDSLFRAGTGSVETDLMSDAFVRTYAAVALRDWDVVHNHAFDVPAIEHAPAGVPVIHTLHLPPQEAIADAIGRKRGAGERIVVAAVSRFAAADWQRSVDVDVVLPNGVPVDRIGVGAGGERALFAGRLSPEKGAIDAIAIARAAGVPLTVVGPAYDEAYARSVADEAGPDVEVLDALPRPELWRLMGSSRAVLCPARWDEPFGLVAAEAQAAGTPVVAYAAGALGEVIRDGVTGALCDGPEDAAAALDDAGAFDRSACRSHAERSLALDATIEAHENLYARVSAESRSMQS